MRHHATTVLQSENFNRLELNGSNPVELEHLLGSVESEAAPALDKLRKQGCLTKQGFDAAICFISMFAARSPFVRNSLAEKLVLHCTSPTEKFILKLDNWEGLNTGILFWQVISFLEMINRKISPSKRLLVSIELILSNQYSYKSFKSLLVSVCQHLPQASAVGGRICQEADVIKRLPIPAIRS